MYSIGEFAKLINVTTQTLRNWDKQNKLKPVILESGHRRYTDEHLSKIKHIDSNDKLNIVYCRESTKAQKKSLDLQIENVKQFCLKQGISIDKCISEFVELTRQHDTWEWRNIYNNEKSRELSILFDALGYDGYISLMTEKLRKEDIFEFDSMERILIDNRKKQIALKCEYYKDKIIYREILGMKAGIVFITYEYRNELAEYFRENKFDVDFTMMIALDPGVVAYRSVREGKAVRPVAELFGGKGHDKAATNPITDEMISKILDVLIK